MSEKKNTGKKAVIAVIVIALIVVIIALAVVISGKSKKGGSKSATEAGTESGSETMRNKLDYYSRCIRDGFDTRGWPDTMAWESVLTATGAQAD